MERKGKEEKRKMEVYIEWVLIENFLIDAALLSLSRALLKRKIALFKTILSAGLGTVFAAVFPLLSFKKGAATLLKGAVGCLLSYAAATEKGWGRAAMNAFSFFACSFFFAGGIFALCAAFSYSAETKNGYILTPVPVGGALASAVLLVLALWFWIARLYKRRNFAKFLCRCKVTAFGKELTETGFLDSGNRASVDRKPLCFISPALAYELLGERTMTEEREIVTVGGSARVKIFQAEKLEIYCGGKRNIIENVYLSPSKSVGTREYTILLSAACWSEE